ncbi:hypothetical protein CLOM_g21834 [Closterium sp. NIES-68]|nr:hypothetical protein CLOM_g21834 [Closterium sp. NIES-68]
MGTMREGLGEDVCKVCFVVSGKKHVVDVDEDVEGGGGDALMEFTLEKCRGDIHRVQDHAAPADEVQEHADDRGSGGRRVGWSGHVIAS